VSRDEAIEAWIAHCAEAGHMRASVAEERGLAENLRDQFARYGLTPRRIYCYQRDCNWRLELEENNADG
jgi:hypothetical protein